VGNINASTAYGYKLNQKLLETINNLGLEQLVNQPTRGNNIFDLIFCSQASLVSYLEIVLGLSDHEAVCLNIDLLSNASTQETRHHILLYHTAHLDQKY